MRRIIELVFLFFYILKYLFLMVFEFIWMVLRFPIRWTTCKKQGHEWLWLGNGFFGFGAPEKSFKCMHCGFKTDEPQNYKSRGESDTISVRIN